MPSSRGCRSSYDCIVKIKGVTARPILFSQLMRSDGEGVINPEELFADDRSPASEQERVREDELHSIMHSSAASHRGSGPCGLRYPWRQLRRL